MNTFEYTCEKNPTKAIELAQNFSKVPVKDKKTALLVFLSVMKNSDSNTKKYLLECLREIHPDSDLYRDADGTGFWQISEWNRVQKVNPVEGLGVSTKDFEVNTKPIVENQVVKPTTFNSCGCASCSGSMYNATGNDSTLNELKTEKTTRKIIFDVIVIAVLVFLLYKIVIKKP
jgi:hypothetical protein